MVAVALVAAGTASGALVGLTSSLLLVPLAAALDLGARPGFAAVSFGLIGTGLALDAFNLAGGRPSPPNSGRQVPRQWGRLFDPRLTAVLYGARLGVGPSTMLSTWTWWSVTVAAGLLGPVPAAVVGGWFGAARLITTVVASALADRARPRRPKVHAAPASHSAPPESVDQASPTPSHHAWFGRLRRSERRNRWAITATGAVGLALAVVLTGCSGRADETASPSDTIGDSSVPADDYTVADRSTTEPPGTTTTTGQADDLRAAGGGDLDRDGGRPTVSTQSGSANQTDETTVLIEPAKLEDVVRTDVIPESLSAADRPAATLEPVALADLLVTSIEGFTPIDDPAADRFLDLEEASAVQPDPTEELALLETRGFTGGWTRAFRNGETNDVAVASVYQFRDATEAEFYLEDGLITIGGYGGSFFDLPDQPGVRGFVQEIDDGDEILVSLGAAFHRGARWHLLYLIGSPETVTADVLVPAIAAQLQAASSATTSEPILNN